MAISRKLSRLIFIFWMINYGELYTGGIINMHNWWLEILVGYGIVIFILYSKSREKANYFYSFYIK